MFPYNLPTVWPWKPWLNPSRQMSDQYAKEHAIIGILWQVFSNESLIMIFWLFLLCHITKSWKIHNKMGKTRSLNDSRRKIKVPILNLGASVMIFGTWIFQNTFFLPQLLSRYSLRGNVKEFLRETVPSQISTKTGDPINYYHPFKDLPSIFWKALFYQQF